jgi:uncharacterized membrane protein (UPF0127 family)
MQTSALQTADGQWIARRLIIARSFGDRLRGVLKHGALQPDTALLISPCTSIHTFAVSFPLDALFLSAQLRILRLAPNIAPWRVRWAPFGTKHVLELPAGTLDALNLQPGTFLCLRTSTDEPESASSASARVPCGSAHLQFSLRIPRRADHDRVITPVPCELRATRRPPLARRSCQTSERQ